MKCGRHFSIADKINAFRFIKEKLSRVGREDSKAEAERQSQSSTGFIWKLGEVKGIAGRLGSGSGMAGWQAGRRTGAGGRSGTGSASEESRLILAVKRQDIHFQTYNGLRRD